MNHLIDTESNSKSVPGDYELEPTFPRRSARSGSSAHNQRHGYGYDYSKYIFLFLHIIGIIIALGALFVAVIAAHKSNENSRIVSEWENRMSEWRHHFNSTDASNGWYSHTIDGFYSHSFSNSIDSSSSHNAIRTSVHTSDNSFIPSTTLSHDSSFTYSTAGNYGSSTSPSFTRSISSLATSTTK